MLDSISCFPEVETWAGHLVVLVRPSESACVCASVCLIYRYTDSVNVLKLLLAVAHENVYH